MIRREGNRIKENTEKVVKEMEEEARSGDVTEAISLQGKIYAGFPVFNT